MNEELIRDYLYDALANFHAYKKLAEKALAQLTNDEFFITIDEESNSIAVIMKHIAGNMLSRWTDFLTTDGEKPDRNRDLEFVVEPQMVKEDLVAYWEKGWNAVFTALEPLRPDDFEKKIMIRGEEHTVVGAINRQMTHYAYHIGQIIFLAKHFRSTEWKSLSIPKNRSAEFNQYLAKKVDQSETQHRFDAAAKFASNAGERKQLNKSAGIVNFHHVNVTVPHAVEEVTKEFYRNVLGLEEVPKPEASRGRGGAWYQLGSVQLHLSLEDITEHQVATRHICFAVENLDQAQTHLAAARVEILSDPRPVPGTKRFYVRDPGGNLIEIAEKKI